MNWLLRAWKCANCSAALLLVFLLPLWLPAQIIWGGSPTQDSLWGIDSTTYQVTQRFAPTLAGYTPTGIRGLAFDPVLHETYALLDAASTSGTLLCRINLGTGSCSLVGNLGLRFSSITFRADGQLFGSSDDPAEGLYLINKTNASKTLAINLGAGGNGEVIAYNPGDNHIYHWSGASPVVMEKIQAVAPYAITAIPTTASSQVTGALCIGPSAFMISDIAGNIRHISVSGTPGSPPQLGPAPMSGLAMPPVFSPGTNLICQYVAPLQVSLAGITPDTVFYLWGDGSSSTVYPAAGASHTYTATGNKIVRVVLKGAFASVRDTFQIFSAVVLNKPTVTINPPQPVSCDSAMVTMTGTFGGDSQWFRNGVAITGLTTNVHSNNIPGIYNMLKTNMVGCTDSAATGAVLRAGTLPDPQIIVDSSACPVISFDLQDSSGVPLSTTWSFGDGGQTTLTGPLASHTYSQTGAFTVIATTSSACGTATDSISILVSCYIGVEKGIETGISVYPNPIQEVIMLRSTVGFPGDVGYVVSDMRGQVLQRGEFSGMERQMEMTIPSSLAPGMYVLRLTVDGKEKAYRLFKE